MHSSGKKGDKLQISNDNRGSSGGGGRGSADPDIHRFSFTRGMWKIKHLKLNLICHRAARRRRLEEEEVEEGSLEDSSPQSDMKSEEKARSCQKL